MTTLDLSALCDPDGHAIAKMPWNVTVDGMVGVFATDGRCGLFLAGETCGNDPAIVIPAKLESLAMVMNGERQWLGPTSSSDVRRWAGECEPTTLEPCESCGGNGQCECPRCDVHHDCGNCKGSGQQTKLPDAREGAIANHVIDRNKVAKVFRDLWGPCKIGVGLSAPSDKKSTQHAILEFRGDGWRAYFAPMDKSGKIQLEWPVLEVGP